MAFRFDPDTAWERIAAAHTGILTTLRRDGRPVALPVWFAVLDRVIYVRTPARAQKLLRIRHDSRAHFLIEAGEAWAELSAVTVAVRAEVVEDPLLATRAQEAIEAKYAAFAAPSEQLPAAVRATYDDMVVVALHPDGRLGSWNNRALLP